MSPQFLFELLIFLLVLDYFIDFILNHLNAKHFEDTLPAELKDVYKPEEYLESQFYKKERNRFNVFHSGFSLMVILGFFFLNGFSFVNELAYTISDNDIWAGLVFFGIILLAGGILNLPFSYYSTFVIEEKYGFNKTSRKTFFLDIIKSALMSVVLGGGILAFIIWIYQQTGTNFWLYAWGFIVLFSLFINMFYSRLIVPIFNKQTPLKEGSLRNKIEAYANKVGFELKNIFVIDGSKRSTKANAYFSGLGREKRITLYDTLINDLEEEEIVAVLAHEVGHYKKKHIVYNLISSIISTGLMLWIFSLMVDSPVLAEALGVSEPNFHIALISFGILYTPISKITGIFMNWLSRKFEYQADNYAKKTYQAEKLISSLKKLSGKSLSNLTPHKAYVFFHYSHPTLLQRIRNLRTDH